MDKSEGIRREHSDGLLKKAILPPEVYAFEKCRLIVLRTNTVVGLQKQNR